MNALRDEVIQRWWPTTQSLDLVRGDIRSVADAVVAEIARFVSGEQLDISWETFRTFDAAIGSVKQFANVPTQFVLLPTRSAWTVLWNNSFHCNGYDSLCWCLTTNHGLTTVHWASHDEETTFQQGSEFIHRMHFDGALVERSVHVSSQDGQWQFHESGPALNEERLSEYQSRQKKDRLNESTMSALLDRLGARPWHEDFYAIAEQPCCVIKRKTPPAAIVRDVSDVIRVDRP